MNDASAPKLNIVELAYQIIDLHEENERLRHRVAVLEDIRQMQTKSIQSSTDANREMMGSVLVALLDPNSRIHRLFDGEAS
jgi:hypothetical protein